MRIAYAMVALALAATAPVSAAERPAVVAHPASGDYVVVVHGWAWIRDTMRSTVRYLNDEDYHVINVSYDARSASAEEEATQRIAQAVAGYCTDESRRIHFVGHSMGCLMIRKYLEASRPDGLGEVVFLAPPNQGIECVDYFGEMRLFRRFFGETAQRLGTRDGSFPKRLGPAEGYAPGIIMGERVTIPVLSRMLPGTDDGVVSVASGKLEGMRELICLQCIHMKIPAHAVALSQTAHFLKHGRFDAKSEKPTKEHHDVRIGGRR